MTTCNCEHWEQCPRCMPNRFDADGGAGFTSPSEIDQLRAENERLRERVDSWTRDAQRLNAAGIELTAENLSLAIANKQMREALEGVLRVISRQISPHYINERDDLSKAKSLLATTSHEALIAAHDAQVRRDALIEAAKVCDVTPQHPFRPSLEAAHELRRMADEVKS